MINLNTQKIIWEQQIQNEYNKYKLFINDNNMPKYKTKYVDVTKTKVSYSMQTLIYQRPVILNINMGVMVNGQNKHCQPTLFHEFTHMWDSENIFLNQSQGDRIRAISLYTEYHASQIEFLRFMEFNSLSDNKTISNTDLFWWLDNELTVYQYYMDHCKLLQESTEKYLTDPTINKFKNVIDSYLYLFGIKVVYDNLFGTIDIPPNNCIFHDEMLKLYERLQEYEVTYLFGILCETQKLLESIHYNYTGK